jgi:hypothetical protein
MYRLVPRFTVALVSLIAASHAFAADFPTGMRPSYPTNWDESGDNGSLKFEFGLRYWLSRGSQNFSIAGDHLAATDTSHILEGHLRIDDDVTRSYVKGLAGYSMLINGTGTTSSASSEITDGKVSYAGGDFGYLPFGDSKSGVAMGFLAGAQYWNDSPNIGRSNFTVASVGSTVASNPATGIPIEPIQPGDSKPDDINIYALRLGMSGKADLGMFDVSGELAAVPYARINGVLGATGLANSYSNNITTSKSSETDIDGWGYGAMGELMVGVHPTENLTVRVGGRAWYLQGTADATYDTVTISDAQDTNGDGNFTEVPAKVVSSQRYILPANPFSLFRYGALLELTAKF